MERDAFGEQRLVDHTGIEDAVEGEDLGIAEGFDLLRDPVSCSLGHRRPPGRTKFGSDITDLCPREADVFLSISEDLG